MLQGRRFAKDSWDGPMGVGNPAMALIFLERPSPTLGSMERPGKETASRMNMLQTHG